MKAVFVATVLLLISVRGGAAPAQAGSWPPKGVQSTARAAARAPPPPNIKRPPPTRRRRPPPRERPPPQKRKPPPNRSPPPTRPKITTVAGDGYKRTSSVYIVPPGRFQGDGGPATSASLFAPNGVAVDVKANLYISDTGNNRIRKVDSKGTITTVAGNGKRGFRGDGGPATSASLYYAYGVAVDAKGNLYIADSYNNRIRKVDSKGTITTVAGNGKAYGSRGDGGPATSATLGGPGGVAVDLEGSLYVAAIIDNLIRKVHANGTITTVAGNGKVGSRGDGGPATSASLFGPVGVAVDAKGNLYIVDQLDHRIRKVDSKGTITTVAGGGNGIRGDGGPATSASLTYPDWVAVDVKGNLYITDNHSVRKVDSKGTITTVAGDYTYICRNDGYEDSDYCDGDSFPDGIGDGGPATSATLVDPKGITLDAKGNLYIADNWSNRIRKVG